MTDSSLRQFARSKVARVRRRGRPGDSIEKVIHAALMQGRNPYDVVDEVVRTLRRRSQTLVGRLSQTMAPT